MLQMSRQDGRTGPVITCDHCHERITEPRLAMALSPMELDDSGDSPVWFVHKGACLRTFERTLSDEPQVDVAVEELTTFMYFLVANVGMTLEALETERGFERELGKGITW